ncbi:hypothetical protein ACFL43_04875 [Thermodesulfobacteriota bacterium]
MKYYHFDSAAAAPAAGPETARDSSSESSSGWTVYLLGFPDGGRRFGYTDNLKTVLDAYSTKAGGSVSVGLIACRANLSIHEARWIVSSVTKDGQKEGIRRP